MSCESTWFRFFSVVEFAIYVHHPTANVRACRSRTTSKVLSLLRNVSGPATHREGRRDPLVVNCHTHACGSMSKDMAMQHPDAWVVRPEGDVPGLVRTDQYRVQVERIAGGRDAVLGQDCEHMAVYVDRVPAVTRADHVEVDKLPLVDEDWRHVGRRVAVEQPGELEAAISKGWAIRHYDRLVDVVVARIGDR